MSPGTDAAPGLDRPLPGAIGLPHLSAYDRAAAGRRVRR